MSEPESGGAGPVPVLELRDLHRRFRQGEVVLEVLRGVDLEIPPGSLTALTGPSGSGKSTLLHISGLLEPPSSGTVRIEGVDCGGLSERERTRLRRERIGFVYQYHHLLADFSALENVVLPQLLLGRPPRRARARAEELLTGLGLADRLDHRPGRLSGGEQQRVAIARALANGPRLVLADEPTGNLDPHTAEEVFVLLLETVRRTGAAALVATHNLELATRMDHALALRDGKIAPVRARS